MPTPYTVCWSHFWTSLFDVIGDQIGDLVYNVGDDFDPAKTAGYMSFLSRDYQWVAHYQGLDPTQFGGFGSSSLENPDGALIDGSYIAAVLSAVRPVSIELSSSSAIPISGANVDWFNLQVLDLLETVVGICGGGSVAMANTSSTVLIQSLQIVKTQYTISCNGDHGTGTTGLVVYAPTSSFPPANFVQYATINTVDKIKPGLVGAGMSINLGPLTQAVRDIARKEVTLQSGDSGPIVSFSSSEVLEP